MRRMLLGLVGAAVVTTALPQSAAATQATLTGVELVPSGTHTGGCSSGTFQLEGIARGVQPSSPGPYPGTVKETGTYSGPPLGGTGQATIDFQIVSGTTVITGTKSGPVTVACFSDAGDPFVNLISDTLPYTATIRTPVGDFADSGTSLVRVIQSRTFASGLERFTSSRSQATPIVRCKPGNGFGDRNHCHSGPPGQLNKR